MASSSVGRSTPKLAARRPETSKHSVSASTERLRRCHLQRVTKSKGTPARISAQKGNVSASEYWKLLNETSAEMALQNSEKQDLLWLPRLSTPRANRKCAISAARGSGRTGRAVNSLALGEHLDAEHTEHSNSELILNRLSEGSRQPHGPQAANWTRLEVLSCLAISSHDPLGNPKRMLGSNKDSCLERRRPATVALILTGSMRRRCANEALLGCSRDLR